MAGTARASEGPGAQADSVWSGIPPISNMVAKFTSVFYLPPFTPLFLILIRDVASPGYTDQFCGRLI